MAPVAPVSARPITSPRFVPRRVAAPWVPPDLPVPSRRSSVRILPLFLCDPDSVPIILFHRADIDSRTASVILRAQWPRRRASSDALSRDDHPNLASRRRTKPLNLGAAHENRSVVAELAPIIGCSSRLTDEGAETEWYRVAAWPPELPDPSR